ncbi:hypothetical protein [Pseudoalteromonas sp. 10-33]|jgi:hypothetical protein|uniref:hypothetical protein n=1 Tax=Pseudoalteromonas sp. 10-33 TaxID=1761890 RepID=UPI001910C5EF|nr:hypothetical protein [Pseudoalteromonas sp. 10-33]
MLKFFFIKFGAFFSGCLLCFVMHTEFNFPAVIAASVVGLSGSFIPFPKSLNIHPNAAIYAGSFAGMCSSSLINSYWELAFISLLGACLYVLTLNLFSGFGGKLGSIAFVSVAVFALAKGIFV